LSRRYQLLSKLGAGAEGSVYLAYDQALSRKVAIKHVLYDHTNYYQVKKLFRELYLLRELSDGAGSKYISKLLDIVADPISS